MKEIALFLAEGFEEIEALTVADLGRRAGLTVDTVSVTGQAYVTGSHGISVRADLLWEEMDKPGYRALVLPGGMPGTKNLEAHQDLMALVDAYYREGRYVAAICAAPSILGHRGILRGRSACCADGFEDQLEGARVTRNKVELSENVITSRGMGTAIPFGLTLTALFSGKEKAEELAGRICYSGGISRTEKQVNEAR